MLMKPIGDNLRLETLENVIINHSCKTEETEFRITYEANRKALLSYRFWRDKTLLPSFYDLPIVPACLGGGEYAYFEKNNKKMSNTIFAKRYTKNYFFKDLSKPLLIENELNIYNWQYLCDRVRLSDDFGADNHIYMYYEEINVFLLLLQLYDVTPYLLEEKMIFLIGEDDRINNYPLNLKMYGIEYSGNAKEISIEEINGLVVNWISPGYSGNRFLSDVMDLHKNLLTTPGFSLSTSMFVYVYQYVLKDRTVQEAMQKLLANNNDIIKNELKAMFDFEERGGKPSLSYFTKCVSRLFDESYKPTKAEWFRSLFLGYSIALGRELNQRIRPMIKIETHGVAYTCPFGHMYDVFKTFKYFHAVSIIRRPSIAFSSLCDTFVANKVEKNYLTEITNRLSLLLENHSHKECKNFSPCYSEKSDEFFNYRVMIRFEDLKLHPKASLKALCEYLGIEWDDCLLETTANGVESGQTIRGPGSGVSGYDKTPVQNLHENAFSRFDHYRFEILFGNKFAPWGYKPMFHRDGVKYTDRDILKLFEIRFKFEDFYSDKAKSENKAAREKFYELIKRLLTLDYQKENMVPIPWLKPKMELVNGELYH